MRGKTPSRPCCPNSRRRRARLAAEPLDIVVVLVVLLVEDLEGDLPVEQPVVRAVDARHAAGSDELLELVAVRK